MQENYQKRDLQYGRRLADPLYGWRVVTSLFFSCLLESAEPGLLRQGLFSRKAQTYFEAMAFVLRQIRYTDSQIADNFDAALQKFMLAYAEVIEEAEELPEGNVSAVLMAPTTKKYLATVTAMTALFREIELYLVLRGDRNLSSSIASVTPFDVPLFRKVTLELAQVVALFPFYVRVSGRNEGDDREIKAREKVTYNVELLSTLMYSTIQMTDCAAEQINLAILRKIAGETPAQQASEQTCDNPPQEPYTAGYQKAPTREPYTAGYQQAPGSSSSSSPAPTNYSSMPKQPPRGKK
jgi:hypothetical protein